jgi:predicted GNAT family acetyltransferase
MARMGRYQIHPEHSVVACADGRLAGFVLAALQEQQGKRIAWNAGTGVAVPFRRQGIAKQLMHKAVEALQEIQVDEYWLEVVCDNVGAIRAYESAGFQKAARLYGLVLEGNLAQGKFSSSKPPGFRLVPCSPSDVQQVEFYKQDAVWENQWFCNRDAEAILVYDEASKPAGYALYQHKEDAVTGARVIAMNQCTADPRRNDRESVLRYMLQHLYQPNDLRIAKRTAGNVKESDALLKTLLVDAGFKGNTEQFFMKMSLHNSDLS